MLRGFATISFYAADLEAAKTWYTELLGLEPYYQVPGYIEFRVDDHQHELGIIDARYAPAGATDGPAGSITYWHVDDLEAALDRLIALGAKEHQAIRKHGEGFVTASVIDPFGNVLGVMYNQHYLDMLAR
ncbi:VOC family protein [Nonomuraea angiospora]|uniref:Enzyme related to lactoylglutathione lyase n=1 Tax=Nonomuraea angiospora TaxID=46172 RepID=A0ABR9M013_9ACTN|nr:VOC family protein [Nonomuraea angiospora]MBE1586232.1 putative enzyme related to lactoylglutathione lyase [Nonomuraea angiospora]